MYRRRWRVAGAFMILAICTSAGITQLQGGRKVESLQNITKTSSAATEAPVKNMLAADPKPLSPNVRIRDCGGGGPKRQGLERSTMSQLRKTAEYETVCGSQVTRRVSLFVRMPTTATEGTQQGRDIARILKEFSGYGISPLVFLEPKQASGVVVNINSYRQGGYDPGLDAYFAAIKAAGVTDSQMGLWNPLPEWNIPVWGNTNATTFSAIVTRTVKLQKKHFPTSKASILLESKTYPSGESWQGGKYVSLLPYVRDIPDGLIDSFGLQGFPWGAMSKLDATVLEPAVYLRTDLAVEAAQQLGAGEIWFNTGTFRTFEKGTGMPRVTVEPKQRQQMLDNVLLQAKAVKTAGFKTAVHLFARDKSATEEKIDWSYWKPGQMNDSPATPVLKTFVAESRTAGVPLWLYDNSPQ